MKVYALAVGLMLANHPLVTCAQAQILTTVSPAMVSFQKTSSARQQIEALNEKVVKAIMARDIKAFEAAIKPRITKDFRYVESGRKQDFKTMVANMKMGFSMLKSMTKCSTAIVKFTQKGKTITSVTKHIMEGTMEMDGKTSVMGFVGMSNDYYRLENGVWKMFKMDMFENKMTMDGKPVDMGAAPN